MKETIEDVYLEAHRALHILWTKAVGTKDYDKQVWKQLDNALSTLKRYATNVNLR